MPQGNAGFCKKDDREKAAEPGIMDGSMKILYYIRRFWVIPAFEKKLLIKGVAIACFFSLMIQILSLNQLIKILTIPISNNLSEYATVKNINLLKKILYRITIIIPWKCTCLIEASTFKYLSNSLNTACSISFVLMKSNKGELIAHSLIKRGNETIFLGLNESRGKELLIF
jgi:hypothetical protein